MMWIIDRIEESIAVIEVGSSFIDVPLSALPDGAKAGDIIELNINLSETNKKKKNIDGLMNSLFKD